MKSSHKIGLGIVVVLCLGVGYWLVSPLFFSNEVAEEGFVFENDVTSDSLEGGDVGSDVSATQDALPRLVSQGLFQGADLFHQAEGTAQLVETSEGYVLRFEDDFSVTNGPDLFVHLGKDGVYDSEARLARLKGDRGSQNYVIPSDISVEDYNEVWVWCRAFSVPFGSALLSPVQ